MANNGSGKKQGRLSQRGRLYLVLGLCCLMLGISCGASLFIVGFGGGVFFGVGRIKFAPGILTA